MQLHHPGWLGDIAVTCRANTLHDRIIQQHEELQLLSTMAMQKRQEDAAGQALEAELSESEEEDDSETELDTDAEAVVAKPDAAAPVPISLEELDQNRQDFHAIMQVSSSTESLLLPGLYMPVSDRHISVAVSDAVDGIQAKPRMSGLKAPHRRLAFLRDRMAEQRLTQMPAWTTTGQRSELKT